MGEKGPPNLDIQRARVNRANTMYPHSPLGIISHQLLTTMLQKKRRILSTFRQVRKILFQEAKTRHALSNTLSLKFNAVLLLKCASLTIAGSGGAVRAIVCQEVLRNKPSAQINKFCNQNLQKYMQNVTARACTRYTLKYIKENTTLWYVYNATCNEYDAQSIFHSTTLYVTFDISHIRWQQYGALNLIIWAHRQCQTEYPNRIPNRLGLLLYQNASHKIAMCDKIHQSVTYPIVSKSASFSGVSSTPCSVATNMGTSLSSIKTARASLMERAPYNNACFVNRKILYGHHCFFKTLRYWTYTERTRENAGSSCVEKETKNLIILPWVRKIHS